MSTRANLLADRLEQGVRALTQFATSLTEAEWQMTTPGDGRTVGVIVHHVASVLPLEIELAQTVARGEAITGVTMADVHAMNAEHARSHSEIGKAAALADLRANAVNAAAAIRALGDAELDRAMPVSLYEDAPLTCQFVLEDHAVRHSYHHLLLLRAAVSAQAVMA